jgi:TusA-related sulfurtransferase
MKRKAKTRVCDTRGKVCPYPLIKALEAMKKLQKGDTLELLTDEPLAIKSVPAECKKYGFKVKVVRIERGWKIVIRR